MIKDLNQEGRARLRALITKCDTGRTGKGTPYLSLTLEDKTGQLDAKFWNLTEEQTRQYKAGQVVEASGDIILHRNAVQLRVRHLDVVPDADILEFVREAPADRDTMDRMLSGLLESMNPGVYRDITCDLIDQRRKAFLTWPAATKTTTTTSGDWPGTRCPWRKPPMPSCRCTRSWTGTCSWRGSCCMIWGKPRNSPRRCWQSTPAKAIWWVTFP